MHALLRLVIFGKLAALFLLAAAPALAAGEPQPGLLPYSATYRATLDKGIPFKGSATRTLTKQDDGSWLYNFQVKSFIADINESSRLNWISGHAQPSIYRYALEGMMIPDRHRAIDFNWAAHQATGNYEGREVDVAFPRGALDPLSFQLQLQQDVRDGEQEMHYKIVDKNRIDEDTFAVLGEETLNGKFGNVNTIKVEKVRAPDSKRKTLMWFAPDWNYLLVRLIQIEPDGTRYEIHLEEATVNGDPIRIQTKS
ncbi:DUF3108 domain-containing protein [Marinobacter halodurans]|uniref:DUF3108 domain-containing protein n=1 Tax=Marinobacter halodurans TaxID=2528979 RepID=A0ABY1ZJ37_9GAMM|nr:DUF3108 domain-containing protein [Marinobacter halodurans]TBW54475.1 DUF3108 domain-containing protein [Marinobacter halodurans]